MIYNIQQLAVNTILANYVIPIDTPTFLGVFKVPCFDASEVSKNVIIPDSECGNVYEFVITGTSEIYEDLTSGDIYFEDLGTWTVDLYYQASTTNLNPTLATFIETFKIQVNGSA
jgi:hypothetical protein|tara:strand:- start:676 stop:1020 length:345 start_codon:yes stop_codon:yes gene_type:complete